MHLLILGCGDIGTRVGSSMADAGWSVSAARRNAGTLSERFDRHQVDLTDPASMAALPVRDPDYILVTPTPQSYDPMGYRKVLLRPLSYWRHNRGYWRVVALSGCHQRGFIVRRRVAGWTSTHH